MVCTKASRPTGETSPELASPTGTPFRTNQGSIIELEPYRIWRDARAWLTTLGCPAKRPIIEGSAFVWLDDDARHPIVHSAPGFYRLVWATAGNCQLEAHYAAYRLPTGQIASLDRQTSDRGASLVVTISNSDWEELQVLAGWINACRSADLPCVIQAA
jgi:hypothetical protein